VASTVVLLRALEERNLIKSENGRICVGWLVVEDIAIIFAIVVLPLFAPVGRGEDLDLGQLGMAMGLTVLKVGVFVALMLFVGGRVFPWLIVRVAHAKSRELMSLGTIALALGVAFIAYFLFQASFALGAFLAGVVLNGTKFTKRVAEDSQPLRDTFAVLFFVSVGMLFDPMILLRNPLGVLAVVAIIILGKGLAAFAIAKLFKRPMETALLVAIALAQIGEFSFVLAGLGRRFDLMSIESYNLVLGGAIISIALNPFLFRLVDGKPPKRVLTPAET
jgi:CPA2 family monovalent cation:H+ antiporter-2